MKKILLLTLCALSYSTTYSAEADDAPSCDVASSVAHDTFVSWFKSIWDNAKSSKDTTKPSTDAITTSMDTANTQYPYNSEPGQNIITHFSWGKTVVMFDNKEHAFQDCKLSSKGPQTWNWDEFNTHHKPGIQIADLGSIIDNNDIIILSRGIDLVLQVKPETIEYLEQSGKKYHVLQSLEAVELYNKLVKQGQKVGMLLHSTC